MNTNAKKLTLKEIEAMPRGSVVWRGDVNIDDGVIWHYAAPAVICVAGPGGYLLGGDEAGTFDMDINEHLMNDPTTTFWDNEPSDAQLLGITRAEFDSMDTPEEIVFPKLATAITSRKMSLENFCEKAGLVYHEFWNAMTGKREFRQWEIVKIRVALNLTDDEVMEIFFPSSVLMKCDIQEATIPGRIIQVQRQI